MGSPDAVMLIFEAPDADKSVDASLSGVRRGSASNSQKQSQQLAPCSVIQTLPAVPRPVAQHRLSPGPAGASFGQGSIHMGHQSVRHHLPDDPSMQLSFQSDFGTPQGLPLQTAATSLMPNYHKRRISQEQEF